MMTVPTQQTQPATKAAKVTRKAWWSAALPILCWQMAALLFVEGVLFCAGIGEEEIFKFDKQLGFRHFPNKIVTWRSEGYARSYFDADGMREPNLTVSKPANTYRVALLGDSEVESLQVPIEKTYGKFIEKNVGPVDGKSVQVLNFGNSGYSTTQECLLLEDKVFKYQPDLVILGYSNRDMMENWSPPDETLSNVRPAALKLPGRDLIIDSSPVGNWLKTPRARFLQSIEVIRQHSRVWGIISATELQLSMKDPIVKSLLGFFTNPIKSFRGWFRSAKQFVTESTSASKMKTQTNSVPAVAVAASGVAAPAVSIPVVATPAVSAPVAVSVAAPAAAITAPATVAAPAGVTTAGKNHPSPPTAITSTKPSAAKSEFVSANSLSTLKPLAKIEVVDPAEKNQFTRLVAATMGGLIHRMDTDCVSHNAKLLVVGMPCRVDLAPFGGVAVNPDITYQEELTILEKLCATNKVSFVDTNTPARALTLKNRESLFFSAHLAPAGHEYMSEQLIPAVQRALHSNSTSNSN